MSEKDSGASLRDRATREPSQQAVSALRAGIASADLLELANKCEAGDFDSGPSLIWAVALTLGMTGNYAFRKSFEADCYLQAAIALTPEGSDWRKFTDRSFSIYASSPYGGGQARYDGTNRYFPLALTAANLRLRAAPLAKQEAAAMRGARAARSASRTTHIDGGVE